MKAFSYRLPIPSAQVKSALIFAALRGEGTSLLKNPYPLETILKICSVTQGLK